MPSKGDIYFSSDFKYLDGETGRKLFIVLNNPSDNEPYIVVKTTSRPPKRPYTELCNPDLKIFYIKKDKEFLNDHTFIQLHEFFPFNKIDFLRQHFNSTLSLENHLSDLRFRQLLNCIKKISDEVPQQYFKLIFG